MTGALDFRSPACATSTLPTLEIQQLHDEFLKRISQAAESVLKELTPEQIREQLNYNEIGFSTIWNKRLLAVQHIAKHYQYVKYEGSHLDLNDIPQDQLAERYSPENQTGSSTGHRRQRGAERFFWGSETLECNRLVPR